MKIIEIGTWDEKGMPTGWTLDLGSYREGSPPCMELLPTGEVLVGGVEIVPWTKERRAAKCTNGKNHI